MNSFITAIISVSLVVLIGFIAGKTNIIDKHHDNGFNIYILKFSLPILLFDVTANAKLNEILNFKMNMAFLAAFIGIYILIFIIHKLIFKRNIQQSAQSSFLCTYPNTAFLGIPLMTAIVGSQALIPITISNIVAGVIIIPITLILIEIGLQKGKKINLKHIAIRVIKTPLMFMSFLGILFALCGIKLPEVIDHSFKTIGSTSAGVSLFTLGLIISRFKIIITKMVLFNVFCKNILHPFIMVFFVKLFSIEGIIAKELIILCAMPPAIATTIFSVTFDIDAKENISSNILATIISIFSMFAFMTWLQL